MCPAGGIKRSDGKRCVMESVKRMDGAKRIENLVDRLAESHILSREEFCFLLDNIEPEQDGYLYGKARKQAPVSYTHLPVWI